MIKHPTKQLLFWIGIVLLLVPGLLHAYLLMPFPGSQDLNAVNLSYSLEKIINPLRIVGVVLLLWYFVKYYAENSRRGRITKVIILVCCFISFYFTDVMFKAQTMFKEPQTIKFANLDNNKVPMNYIIIGIVQNGVAKAYPLIYLGYHHKIQDNVGKQPVLVTYCTMCRTGRVYNPVINGIRQNFRLVGARNYNAIIEDEGTKTWWYQATGTAIAGKLKGSQLQELPYEQSTLLAWLNKYPSSLILQADPQYANNYDDLKDYDRLQAVDKDSTLINKDTLIRKSWVLGVVINGQAKAYDWRHLSQKCLLNDNLNQKPLLLTIEDDGLTFHAFNPNVNGKVLHFDFNDKEQLIDKETASVWDWNGLSTSGTLKGSRLSKIQAYQEYWHSWKHFHPNTFFWKD